jgi:hypothetical protein
MLLPDCTAIKISDQVYLGRESLLSLMLLLSPHTPEDRDHDTLLPTAVDGCNGGDRGSAKTTGSVDPERKRGRADGCDGARRSDRSDGSHSDGGLSGGRRKR